MGRVPISDFGDHWGQVYLVISNFCNWLLFFAGHRDPPDLAKFKGRTKEEYGREWVKHGWSNNGRRGKDGGGKGRRISIYPT